MLSKKVLLLVGLLVLGCPSQGQETVIPEPFTDDDPTQCAAGCARLKELQCPEGEPLVYTDKLCQIDRECNPGKCVRARCTESCEDVCEDLIKNGRFMGAGCWKTINSCEEIETVCRR